MEGENWNLVKRFFRHWLAFAFYVLLCAHVVMRLEGEAQSERKAARKARWNETRHSALIRNLTKLKETAKLTAHDEQVCLKDSKYILFEILANRT